MSMSILPGDRVTFTSTGSADGFPVEFAHTGQDATVVRELTEREVDIDDVGRMFDIRFDDGVEVSAFIDELSSPFGEEG